MSKENKYLKESMTIGYGLVVNDRILWPSNFNQDMKMTLIKGFIEYWSELEDYEKCAVLHKILETLEKKNISKRK